jgi:multidrug efflux pump subunit AcrB
MRKVALYTLIIVGLLGLSTLIGFTIKNAVFIIFWI